MTDTRATSGSSLYLHVVAATGTTMGRKYSPRARNRFNQVVEAKRFEGVSLCRKVC